MELFLMVTITDKQRLTDFVSLYQNTGVPVHYITIGRGTAGTNLLSAIGNSGIAKAIVFSAVTGETWAAVSRSLRRELRIDVPGTGIAFTVPLSSIGGKRELAFLTEGQNYEKGEESEMKGTEHELLISIAAQGTSDLVMDAAKKAGASGGTVIHAKGTGQEQAERFLGISLADEKDIIFIVTPTAKKNAIMRSVMENAGKTTVAKAIVFSLPVTDTAGLRLTEEV